MLVERRNMILVSTTIFMSKGNQMDNKTVIFRITWFLDLQIQTIVKQENIVLTINWRKCQSILHESLTRLRHAY